MKPVERISLALLILLFVSSAAFTQKERKLDKAEVNNKYKTVYERMKTAYDLGRYEDVLWIYEEECMEKVIHAKPKRKESHEFKMAKKNIRGDIYLMLVLCNIELNKVTQTQKYLQKLLPIRFDEKFTDYGLTVRKAIEEKYYVGPRFLVGLKIQANITNVQVIDSFRIFDLVSNTAQESDFYSRKYKPGQGLSLGLLFEYAFLRNVSFSVQPTYDITRYNYKTLYKWRSATDPDRFVIMQYTNEQRLNSFFLPIFLKYTHVRGRVKPYIQGGAFISTRLIATKEIEVIEQDKEAGAIVNDDPEVLSSNIIGINSLMNNVELGITGEVGINFSLGPVYAGAFLNYRKGFTNIINERERYTDPTLVHALYDVADDLKAHSYSLGVSISYPITYKAFKRHQKTSKSN